MGSKVSLIIGGKVVEYISATEAASILSCESGIKKDFTYWLGDNRRGRHKSTIGVIPSLKRSGRVYYRRSHIEFLARELYMSNLIGSPIMKIFR